MRRRLSLSLALLAGALALIVLANYWFTERHLSSVLNDDPRNTGVVARAHYDHFVDPNILVLDLRGLAASNSEADVFRVVLQFAAAQKEQKYSMVKLNFKGDTRFELKGEYFQTLGEEYGGQNPVYTMRTFPENLLRPDGTEAFEKWTGGLLGVMSRQMQDFSEFHKQWYLVDLSKQ